MPLKFMIEVLFLISLILNPSCLCTLKLGLGILVCVIWRQSPSGLLDQAVKMDDQPKFARVAGQVCNNSSFKRSDKRFSEKQEKVLTSRVLIALSGVMLSLGSGVKGIYIFSICEKPCLSDNRIGNSQLEHSLSKVATLKEF